MATPIQNSYQPFLGSSTIFYSPLLPVHRAPSSMQPSHVAYAQASTPNLVSPPSAMLPTPPYMGFQSGSPALPSSGPSWGQSSLRLKLPDCTGLTDVEEWLLRVSHYFNYYNVPEWDRMKVCSVQMKGPAAYWFDWLMKIRVISQEDFCQSIRIEFAQSKFTNHVIS